MTQTEEDTLVIAGRSYRSGLLIRIGKFNDLEETRKATEAAGAKIVTGAVRRTNIGQDPSQPNLLQVLPPDRCTILPNTAGCYTADAASAMELDCEGVLMNIAIAGARNPVLIAHAMKLAIQAGRVAFRAGRNPRKRYASASSPIAGTIG